MASLKEEALAYVSPKTLNIADLEKVPVNLDLKVGTGKANNGEDFTYKYIDVEGKQYRVPGTVLGGIKAILGKFPNTQFVSVLKEGEGKTGTRYQVIPIN